MSFETVIGHEHARRFFEEAGANDRLGHAYLFHGPEGVGKRSFARALARNLFCGATRGVHENSCGRCRACLKVDSGNHPDLLVPGDENDLSPLGIDAVRSLRDEIHLRPVEGGGKVVVLTHVHRLREEAATALLKTLEEPPAGTLLILTASDLLAVRGTIRSRCQPVRFPPLAARQVEEELDRRGELDREQARHVACICEGSLGRALRFVEDGFLEQLPRHRAIWLERFRVDARGGPGLEELLTLAREGGDRTGAELRRWLRSALDLGASLLRDVGLNALEVSGEHLRHLDPSERSSYRGDADGVMDLVGEVMTARADLDRNLTPAVVLADLEIRLQHQLAGA